MQLVQTHGPLNWVRIAQTLGSRTPKQCRERYHQNLKPTLNHDPITPEEGVQIERLVHEIGKRWAEIARRLHGRSDNAVKNWWNGSQNRRKRQDRRRTVQPATTYDDRYPRASMSMTSNAGLSLPRAARPLSPSSQHHQASSPWLDAPLPSPCYSESAESDTGSNYTTSPARTSRLLPAPVELAPLRTWPPAAIESAAQLPRLSSLASPELSKGHSEAHFHIPSRPCYGQLPTAPSSPVQPQAAEQQRPPSIPVQHIKQRTGSVDRDSRMNVAALLA